MPEFFAGNRGRKGRSGANFRARRSDPEAAEKRTFAEKVRATQGYDTIDPKYLHSAARVGRAMREALRARGRVQP